MLFIKCNIPSSRLAAGAFAILMSGIAHGEIYKHVDENGRVTYSNVPIKGAIKLNLEPLTTVPAVRPKTTIASPSGFPKVDSDTQKKRDDTRRKILEEEFAAEEKLLDEAKRNLTEGEQARLNGARNQDRLQSLKEEVGLHERNVAALKKELSNLK